MQYFVVLEDNKRNRWQAELLYESIRLLNLSEQFLIAICPGDGTSIVKHRYPNVVYFENIGQRLGFPRFNKVYGLLRAIESGKLKQPFVLLGTDMFLLNSIPETDAPVSAQQHRWLVWDNVDDRVKDMTIKDNWVNYGGVYVFNDVPMKVLEDSLTYTHDLYKKFGNNPKWNTYGFSLGIINNNVPFEGKQDYEMPLMNNNSPDVRWNSSPIVHYNDGYPPHFHKDRVFETINFSFGMPLPFKLILDAPIRNQPNVAIMQTLVRSWLESNLTRVHYLL